MIDGQGTVIGIDDKDLRSRIKKLGGREIVPVVPIAEMDQKQLDL